MSDLDLRPFILVPEDDLPEWHNVAGTPDATSCPMVQALTWRRGFVVLRRSIVSGREDLLWMAFAAVFSGIVAQKLLDIGKVSTGDANLSLGHAARTAAAVRLLTEAWE